MLFDTTAESIEIKETIKVEWVNSLNMLKVTSKDIGMTSTVLLCTLNIYIPNNIRLEIVLVITSIY